MRVRHSGAAADAKMWAFAVLLLLLGQAVVGQLPDANDVSCLAGLKQGFRNSAQLETWISSSLATPCFNQSFTSLMGVICNSNRVISVSLAGKHLGGVISPAIINCSNLNSLDLSGNDLTGPIPQQIGQLGLIVKLNLSKNGLTGSIPDSMTNCSFLNLLDLHGNRLTGTIPFSLGSISRLTTFDVSDNDLSGRIPYALANTSTGPRFNASSFRGNKGLYGYPLSEPKSHALSVVAIVAIGLGSGLLSLVISFTAVCVWLRLSDQRLAAEEGKISQLTPE